MYIARRSHYPGLISKSEEARYGADWSRSDLDLIVADYFVMLADEQAGRHYGKAVHDAALRERIPRNRGSVGFK
jgi:hypothetical protein